MKFQVSLLNFSLCLMSALLCGLLVPVSAQEMDHDKTLDTVEIQVLGRKYENLSQERRLTQLERQLNANPPVKASSQYRVNQLINAHQRSVSEAQRREAVKAYNTGIDLSRQGKNNEAIAIYQQALTLDPYLIPAYNNLANLQESLGAFDQAQGTYQKAIEMAPNEPLLHFNLAVIQEKQGKIMDAYEHYRQYVKLSSSPDPQIVELVRSFDARRFSASREPDYSTLTTKESRGERLIWQDWQMPLPVFVVLNDPSQALFVPEVYKDFDTWTHATQGRLRFREVGYPDQARILITLKQGPLMDANASIGHASFNIETLNTEDPMKRLRVTIVVNTGEPGTAITLENRKQQVRKLVLHELGHAIGIWGHSSDPGDIMYTHPLVSELSSRDVRTIQKLYGIQPVPAPVTSYSGQP
ncbi:tetratricopeptide repeat protein [Vampirovibrio chlorellavorus]|uniref:tetratricopeptide repeat protein n=1 Tax=Vampirovibrio chlorellavorus TaxID=758823 RepID=UPI0026F126FC|nr:tetratricopeptide repeat protein [Vampirovibrio chlorellavorus]